MTAEYWMILVLFLLLMRSFVVILKDTFRISYYKTKLKNRGVDTSEIDKMSLWKMFTD